MTQREVRRRTGGRSAVVRQAVLTATLQSVAERGVDQITVGEIARAAGVHETTVYRRWGTAERLVVDAFLAYSHEQIPVPDTGSLRQDLIVFACSVADYLDTTLGRALARAMAVVDDDPQLGAARAQFWQERKNLAQAMIDRAVARGELAHDVDPQIVLELLVAPIHFRALFTREPIDEHHVTRLVDILLNGTGREADAARLQR
jgi:AcrR family transcriptional regulator